jgi:anti-sigma B factor antagonist
MQKVNYVDSSDLGALVAGFKAARSQNSEFALVGVGRQITVALELTRLNKVFSVYSDVPSALAATANKKER